MGKVVIDYIGLARAKLVRARFLRQEADRHQDMIIHGDVADTDLVEKLAKTALVNAWECRLNAKWALQQEEKLAGKEYTVWGATRHGAKRLQGKHFCHWSDYRDAIRRGEVDTWRTYDNTSQ